MSRKLGVYTVFYRCRRCGSERMDHTDHVADSALLALKECAPILVHWCTLPDASEEAWGILEPYEVHHMGAA